MARMRCGIAGLASAIGSRRPIEELALHEGATPERIQALKAVGHSHFLRSSESFGDLWRQAADRALEGAGVGPGDLEAVLVSTLGGAIALPDTVQSGPMAKVWTLSLTTQNCSADIAALYIGSRLMRADRPTNVLIVTGGFGAAERFGSGSGVVMGDAMASCVLTSGRHELELVACELLSDAALDTVPAPSGQARHFARTAAALDEVVGRALAGAGLGAADIGQVFCTSGNALCFDFLASVAGLPIERLFRRNFEIHGHVFCADNFLGLKTYLEGVQAPAAEHLLMVSWAKATLAAAVLRRI